MVGVLAFVIGVYINKSDFIILLTGCDFRFLSFFVVMTVDVPVSTAEDDGKITKPVNTSCLFLPHKHTPTSCSMLPPSESLLLS